MTGRDVLAILRRYGAALAASVLLGGVLGGVIGAASQSGYTGTTRLYAVSPLADNASAQQQTIGVMRMGSYAQLVTGSRLAERIVSHLNLEADPADLASRLEVATERDTVAMEVSVTAEDAAEAEAILRVLPEELTAVLAEVSTEGRPAPDRLTTFVTIDGPHVGEAGSLRGLLSSVLVGLVLGTVAGLLLLAALMRRDPAVGEPASLARTMNVPLIGALPARAAGSWTGGRASVAGHRLAVGIRGHLDSQERPVVAVTGSRPDAESSAVATEVAEAFAERGFPVLYVTTDGTGVPRSAAPGESSEGRAPIHVRRVEPTEDGVTPHVAARQAVLGEPALGQVVVVDLPDVTRIAPASALLDTADLVGLVYRQDASKESEIRHALESLDAMSPAPVGLIAHGRPPVRRRRFRR